METSQLKTIQNNHEEPERRTDIVDRLVFQPQSLIRKSELNLISNLGFGVRVTVGPL